MLYNASVDISVTVDMCMTA